ncbi:MAG: transcription-repair coupling factor [Fidelibacterota bacterium]|nr:MAG: transcription-repair coupling factor [Candidatus Neomarinimicrobiota bacterium]
MNMNQPVSLVQAFSSRIRDLGLAAGTRITGLPQLALPLVLKYLHDTSGWPVLASLKENESALAARDILIGLINAGEVAFYPSTGHVTGVPQGFVSPMDGFRLSALASLGSEKRPPYLLLTNESLEEGLPSEQALHQAQLAIRPGTTTYADLRAWLEDNDYEHTSLVTEPGVYALRGSIIDCYPVNAAAPVRMDFMDEKLDEIREFDVHTQISSETRASATLLSLKHAKTDRVPVTEHYPEGWILIRQEEDRWAVSSSKVSSIAQQIDLEIELLESRGANLSLLQARWELLKERNDTAGVYFAGGREAQSERARVLLLPQIPMALADGTYPAGFTSGALGLMVVTPTELWGRPAAVWKPKRKQFATLSSIRQHVETLEPGNPLVHVNYGIGRYVGLTQLNVGGTQQECLTIEYKDGDRVHVSTDKISLVFPYTVEDDRPLQLDSLSAKRWERIKRQTRRSAEEVVNQLAELYARRMLARGVAFPEDDSLQLEMEEAFPYEDTPDQVRATSEIKVDMEGSRPMDRLLCGDVGFGKTELAMRAAFKAIQGGYQVALMAPTTILADQHFISFRARLEPFAVNVSMLSRFVSPAKQKNILKDLESGKIDLVIGTHRILSNDIAFNRLGLLIIDEEHRFGVKQKERIKEFRTDIDVLSLSATPIPRTLHFSMAKIRDISRLDTPPLERVPIITAIHYYLGDLIRSAVTKEVQRGGQVYIVHNEVKSIERLARDLANTLPGITIGIAHGQMASQELEHTMLSFASGGFQVLVCTSIIESGIDLPNVNTVIINNAHRFGLAQLYQIRGRVGRSNRQAYALLLIPRRPKPSPEALKRLKTIERHTALGSGYAIALRDLEIRGTGNLFGVEQSGHVAAVGLDLYTKIVQDIVRERALIPDEQEAAPISREDVAIHVFPQARIPEDYVPDPHLRLNLYRRLSILHDLDELRNFKKELRDRFGPIPSEVGDLLTTVALRIQAAKGGIRSVRLKDENELQIDYQKIDDPSVLINQIQSVLEPLAVPYRFQNLKNSDLRVIISLGNRDAMSIIDTLFLSRRDLKYMLPQQQGYE